jgi:hypothetical protein
MTYSELLSYYIPFVHPWLQVQLNIALNPTIIDNPSGLLAAHDYYNGVLGKDVWAVAPETLIDLTTGEPNPLRRDGPGGQITASGMASSMQGANGGELNPNLSYQGNMTFAYREIESLNDIATRTGVTFIPMTPANYNTTVYKYTDKIIKDDKQKLELGQSTYLSYQQVSTSTINQGATG